MGKNEDTSKLFEHFDPIVSIFSLSFLRTNALKGKSGSCYMYRISTPSQYVEYLMIVLRLANYDEEFFETTNVHLK